MVLTLITPDIIVLIRLTAVAVDAADRPAVAGADDAGNSTGVASLAGDARVLGPGLDGETSPVIHQGPSLPLKGSVAGGAVGEAAVI